MPLLAKPISYTNASLYPAVPSDLSTASHSPILPTALCSYPCPNVLPFPLPAVPLQVVLDKLCFPKMGKAAGHLFYLYNSSISGSTNLSPRALHEVPTCTIRSSISISLHALCCCSTVPAVAASEVRALGAFSSLPCLFWITHHSCCNLPNISVWLPFQSLSLSPFPFFFVSGFKNTIVKVRKLWRQKANFSRSTSKCSFCFLGVMFANSRVSLARSWHCWKLLQAEFVCFLSSSCDNSSTVVLSGSSLQKNVYCIHQRGDLPRWHYSCTRTTCS